jgi:integrase/recombinase XerD
MTVPSYPSGNALRERMIEDMGVRGCAEKTRHDYIRRDAVTKRTL